jgi:hypothetical protein
MSVRLSGAGIVRLHAQVRLVPLKRGRCNLAHERPLCAARSFRSRPPSCAGARKTTQATHPSHVRGPLLLGMQVACAMQSNSAMRAMMSANSNVRRRGRATVQGTKNGALRSTCKGAGWTATVHPKHRLANVRHPHAAADSVEVRISQDCTVCESKCFTRSSSGAFTAPAGFLAGRGGDAQARRHLHGRRGAARLRAAWHARVGLRAPQAVCPTSSRSASSWATAIWFGKETIAAGGDRVARQAHPIFQHLWRQPGVLRQGPCGSEGHQGRPAAGADQRERDMKGRS